MGSEKPDAYPKEYEFPSGQQVVVKAVPASGYRLVDWGGSVGGSAETVEFAMTCTKSATAVFAPVALGSSVSATTSSGTLDARTTQGVDVTITVADGPWVPAAGDIIAVAHHTENPKIETPQPALPDGFYDVLVVDSAGAAQTQVLIKLYNDAVTDDTVAYVWSESEGAWAPCSSQGSDSSGGFVWINVTGVAESVPTIVHLQGSPFALAEPAAEVGEETAPVESTVLMVRGEPDAGGDVVVDPQPNSGQGYVKGTRISLRASAAEGYRFSHWSGGMQGEENPVTVIMDAGKEVNAHFVEASQFAWWWVASGVGVVAVALPAYFLVARRTGSSRSRRRTR